MNRLLLDLLRLARRRAARPPAATASVAAAGSPRWTSSRPRTRASCCARTCRAWSHDDVSIRLENNVLTIAGERKAQQEEPATRATARVERGDRHVRPIAQACPRASTPRASRRRSTAACSTVRIPKPVQAKPRARGRSSVGGGEPRTIEARRRPPRTPSVRASQSSPDSVRGRRGEAPSRPRPARARAPRYPRSRGPASAL